MDIPALHQPAVYIILVNWNGWQDTVECLESLLRIDYERFTVIVCDNGSTDASIEQIERWAEGTLAAPCRSANFSRLVLPPLPKPIPVIKLTTADQSYTADVAKRSLVLIQVGANRGFAGGNNVGIEYALSHGDCEYVWLLNNDTVVERDSLTRLVRTAQADPRLGICGSLLRTYDPPHEVQTAGRRYCPWTGRTHPVQDSAQMRHRSGGYIVEGASMLVSRRFLEEVGLLNEDYFLFFEELDWITRSNCAFRIGHSPVSVVYHKVGASTGSAMGRGARSVLSDFYQARNRLVFTKKYYSWCLPSVMAAVAASAIQRALSGRPHNAAAILRGAIASFSRTRSTGQALL